MLPACRSLTRRSQQRGILTPYSSAL
uniref:Cl362_2b n=1 Tax=Arundo donax TaxID=35708 RepID=A0A0A9EGL0_ARUDO